MWGKIIIPMYRLWLNGLYGLYGPRCPLFSKRPINLISLSLSLLSWFEPLLIFNQLYIVSELYTESTFQWKKKRRKNMKMISINITHLKTSSGQLSGQACWGITRLTKFLISHIDGIWVVSTQRSKPGSKPSGNCSQRWDDLASLPIG